MINAPAIPANRICFLGSDEFKRIDALMETDFHVSVAQLMECAGLATSELAKAICAPVSSSPKISIMIGKGNNGGDGLIAAAHLKNWGYEVCVYLCHSLSSYPPLCLNHIHRLQASGIKIKIDLSISKLIKDTFLISSDLIIDGLLGVGLKGALKAPYIELIPFLNKLKAPILSIDVPSGLNATTGEYTLVINSDTTISFGAPKIGFLSNSARETMGRLLIADIGIPHLLYKRLKYSNFPQFSSGKFIEVFF